MADRFSNHASGLSSPPGGVDAITPSDTTDLANVTRGLNVSGSGVVRVTTVLGTTETVFVAAGVVFPIRATRVWAQGTDATGIRGLY
ncbi:spike base protein, RCAP_Rcc01079 family [Palleronia abyssalis]|uniref:Uncharacterized protein n=1 Tax=Palleronia abyssalis TaxID=1501240 RepID=A0A2R8BTJ9_9RHOB|nr:hypothetical protein [Palleronia abyssalis]SPJ23481.1 hypothetical protein PAA8504_01292 [Palleronia abyssalis]